MEHQEESIFVRPRYDVNACERILKSPENQLINSKFKVGKSKSPKNDQAV